MDLGRAGSFCLRGVLVDGVERQFAVAEPTFSLLEQPSATHRIEDQPAAVGDEFLQDGNRPGILAHVRIVVRNDRAVKIYVAS